MADFTLTWCLAPGDAETDFSAAWERYVADLDDADLLAVAVAADPFLDADDDDSLAEFDAEYAADDFRQSLLDAGRELLRRVRREGNREILWLPDGIHGLPVFVAGGMTAGDFSTGDGFDWIHLVDAASKHRALPWA